MENNNPKFQSFPMTEVVMGLVEIFIEILCLKDGYLVVVLIE
jgi:hypothetical protein